MEDKHAILTKLAKEIGPVPTVVLYNLIATFPERMVLLDETAWMQVDQKARQKLGLRKKEYRKALDVLLFLKFIDEVDNGKHHLIKINFEKLDSYKE